MANLRQGLIRLASSYPAKSEERRTLLALLQEEGTAKTALTMESNVSVIPVLNGLLRKEMTAVNQYMVQHAVNDNWGYKKLGGILRAQAITEMRHAEALMERIIFLEAIPEVGRLDEVHIGSDVESHLQNNWASEREAVGLYNQAIAFCAAQGDQGTRKLLEGILAEEEFHLDFTQSMLQQIKTMGLSAFLAEQI